MKTVIFLPDELFARAETEARKLGVSRSEFYAKAIAEFVGRHQAEDVTERLNQVYGASPCEVDPRSFSAPATLFSKDEW